MSELRENSRQVIETSVLIIGAGLVGSTFAGALSHAEIDSVSIDIQQPNKNKSIKFDGRASAIAQGSKMVFDTIGLWDNLEKFAAPILGIRVSEGSSSSYLHFDHKEVGEEPFGFMLENRFLRLSQNTIYKKNTYAKLIAPSKIIELKYDKDHIEVQLADGLVVRARLLVGADGRESDTRKKIGIPLTKLNYDQTAIVCSVQHQKSHNYIAHEHFMASGPFAILPLNGTQQNIGCRSSIVWIETPELAATMIKLCDEDFLFEVSQRFGDFLGQLKIVSSRWQYPLSMQFAPTYISRRAALIGDAAHGIHPIAGQGLNMGIRDLAVLAEVISDASRSGRDIGSQSVLRQYQRRRRFDNTIMLAGTDGLNRLFSNSFPPLKLFRNFGLRAVNRIPSLKRAFMLYAMGKSQHAPRLMRGIKI